MARLTDPELDVYQRLLDLIKPMPQLTRARTLRWLEDKMIMDPLRAEFSAGKKSEQVANMECGCHVQGAIMDPAALPPTSPLPSSSFPQENVSAEGETD